METDYTTEDQLVTARAAPWDATRPAGVPESIPVYHFRRNGQREVPCIVIGHQGFERETMKGMDGTGRVRVRVAVITDLDVTPAEDHRAIAAACDRALAALSTDDLALTYIHAMLREAPEVAVEDRRQHTVLRYIAVATRCEPV